MTSVWLLMAVGFPEIRTRLVRTILIAIVRYAQKGIHKGMQGWICDPRNIDGTWLVNFPLYGEEYDIAILDIKEDDLRLLPDGMDARVNERIKAQYEDSGSSSKFLPIKPDDLSSYLI